MDERNFTYWEIIGVPIRFLLFTFFDQNMEKACVDYKDEINL